MPVLNVGRRLLLVLLGVIWLGPSLFFWMTTLSGTASLSEGQITLNETSDSYYSISDHRCYALVFTDTVLASHSLEGRAVSFTHVVSQPLEIASNVDSGQRQPFLLQPDKQVLVAEDDTGRRAALGVYYYLGDTSETVPITRTLSISLSDHGAKAIYVAEVPTHNVPSEFKFLQSGVIEPDLFIKRIFYSNPRPFKDLGHCNQPPMGSTQSSTHTTIFTGGELSAIQAPQILIQASTIRIKVEALVNGWRYNPNALLRVFSVSPSARGFTQVTLVHNYGRIGVFHPLPTLRQERKLVWENPATRINLVYDLNPESPLSADVRNMAQAITDRIKNQKLLRAYHFFLALLTTIVAPLLPLTGLWLSRNRDLTHIWSQLVAPLRLAVLIWVGPIGAAVVVSVYGLWPSSAAFWVSVWSSGMAVIVITSPVTFPTVVGWVKTRFGQYRVSRGGGILLLVAGMTTLSWLLLANLHVVWRHPLTLPLNGLLLALVIWALASALGTAGPGLIVSRLAWVAWALLLVLLAIPLSNTVYWYDPWLGWSMDTQRSLFLVWGIFGLPYLGLLGGFIGLKSASHGNQNSLDQSMGIWLPGMVFVFLVGFTGVFPQVVGGPGETVVPLLISPVPFILAALLFPLIVSSMPSTAVQGYVFNARKELLGYAIAAAGQVREVVLAFGPWKSNWDNARSAARYGVVLGAILAFGYGYLLVPGVANRLNTPFLPLVMLVAFILPIFVRWSLSSFFLGYFFTRLPGTNGAVKGLVLGCAIAASVFTYDFVFRVESNADLIAFFTTDVVLTVLGLVGVGAGIDYQTIQQRGYSWRELLTLYNMPYLVGYISALLATLSSTFIGFLNGQLGVVASSLVDTILRTGGG